MKLDLRSLATHFAIKKQRQTINWIYAVTLLAVFLLYRNINDISKVILHKNAPFFYFAESNNFCFIRVHFLIIT